VTFFSNPLLPLPRHTLGVSCFITSGITQMILRYLEMRTTQTFQVVRRNTLAFLVSFYWGIAADNERCAI